MPTRILPEGQALVDEYPKLFNGIYPECGIWIPHGWYNPVYKLCASICELLKTEALGTSIEVSQIKEKFHTLRFYYHLNREHMDNDVLDRLQKKIESYIDDAYIECTKTCQECGSAGEMTYKKFNTVNFNNGVYCHIHNSDNQL